MSERNLRSIGAGLLLAGALALAVQMVVSLATMPDAAGFMPFLLVISGPQLLAGLWVVLPWGTRRAARYLLPIIIGVWVSLWNIAVLAEGPLQALTPFQTVSLGIAIVIQATFPLIAAVVLARAWWIGRRSHAEAHPADGAT